MTNPMVMMADGVRCKARDEKIKRSGKEDTQPHPEANCHQ